MEKAKEIEIVILCGLFLTISIGIFCFVHYKIEKPNTYKIHFKDIDSIVKGSPVRFMGINVGHVVELKRGDDVIICKIRVTKKGVKLPNGTKAKVEFNGLGGSKSIELLPPDDASAQVKGIIAEDSLRINDFVGVIKDLRDVCITIFNMVEKIDPNSMSDTIKEVTNPEGITKVDNVLQKTTDKVIKKEKEASTTIQNINNFLKIKEKGDSYGKN